MVVDYDDCERIERCYAHQCTGHCDNRCRRYIDYLHGWSDGVDYACNEIKEMLKKEGTKNDGN